MRAGIFASFTFCAVFAGGTATAAPQDWYGTYAYSEALGRDGMGAGAAAFMDHRLTLGPKNCRFTAQGYQQDTQIRCEAVPVGDGLQIRFVSFGDGRVENQYGVRPYSAGQPLFLLTRRGGVLTTMWQGYQPAMKSAASGVFFRKAP